MRRRSIILIGLAILLLIGLLGAGLWWFTRPARQLAAKFEGPASFSIRYPMAWASVIPEQGIMVLAEPDTLQGAAGPSVTLKRDTTLMLEGDLATTLETYLSRGPEARGEWTRLTDITSLTLFGDRDAASVDLQGYELEGDPEMRVRLIVTRTDTMVVYVIALSTPPETWDDDEPLLTAILDSLRFTE